MGERIGRDKKGQELARCVMAVGGCTPLVPPSTKSWQRHWHKRKDTKRRTNNFKVTNRLQVNVDTADACRDR